MGGVWKFRIVNFGAQLDGRDFDAVLIWPRRNDRCILQIYLPLKITAISCCERVHFRETCGVNARERRDAPVASVEKASRRAHAPRPRCHGNACTKSGLRCIRKPEVMSEKWPETAPRRNWYKPLVTWRLFTECVYIILCYLHAYLYASDRRVDRPVLYGRIWCIRLKQWSIIYGRRRLLGLDTILRNPQGGSGTSSAFNICMRLLMYVW